MRYLTARKRAEGLGSSHHGTEHHIAMTVSGWALLFIVPVFVFVLARTIGGGYDEVRATFANPFFAVLTALFLFVVFSVLVYAIRAIAKARRTSERTDRETPFVALGDDQVKAWL